MRVEQFDFELPAELIAQAPTTPRDAARLLRVGPRLAEARVRDLPDLLRQGDLLVVNDTRVLRTRFWGRRGEASIEVTLVEAEDERSWWALARPGRRLRPGDRVLLADTIDATVAAKAADGRVLLTFDHGGEALLEAMRAHGAMPLPPYIRRSEGGDSRDHTAYQTLFAAHDGAVAAPTASLHFTPDLMGRLEAVGIGHVSLTLHVGAGTFAPVKCDDTADHVMHAERFVVPAEAAAGIQGARERGGRIIAVGTTVLRALETAAREDGTLAVGAGETRLFVTPGYRFRVVDLLLTNFHLPRSTLFMLVCAFAGTGVMQAAYRHAVERDFRFFSYGDACLLERAA